jgi:lysosomal Pro-X carboxypeptidase
MTTNMHSVILKNISVIIFLTFLFIQLTSAYDFRNGMSGPWSTYKRNKIQTPLITEIHKNNDHSLEEAKNVLKEIMKKQKNLNKMDIIKMAEEKLNKFKAEKLEKLKSKSHVHVTSEKNESDFIEKFVKVKVDHFSLDNPAEFNLRYLIKDKYFDKSTSNTPILFYCGNEGSIEDFWKNSGFITETLAKEFKGFVIFGEHRFFGKSFPMGGPQDYDIKKNRYLNVEQALGDFIELLHQVRKIYSLDESHPVIAFGGSYGGMLAAWARMKFPHIFKGAIASSAPILLFEDINKISNSFFKIVTETYKRYDHSCPESIRKGFKTLDQLKNSTKTNENVLNELNKIFNICTPMKNSTEIQNLEDTIEDALVALAQYNYPYETSFLNPTPGYPVKVACERIKKYKKDNTFSDLLMGYNDNALSPLMQSSIAFTFNKFNQISPDMKDSLNFLKEASSVFFNYTGTQKCLDIGNKPSETSELNGWSFMACTEMVMPMQKDGVTDMFSPKKWNLEEFTKECKNTWNADVRPEWAFDFFGGRNFDKEIHNYSNILFTNGKMDPWNAGCPHVASTKSVFIIESDSAHHLDLRLPNEKDPESVNNSRKLSLELIRKWIKQ